MKKITSLILLCFVWVGVMSAQQSVFTVQGHPRNDIQVDAKKQQTKSSSLRNDANFSFDNIQFWVGEGENRAMLVIDWYLNGSQTLVWGYRWDGTARGIDMILAIAKADPRLTFFTHNTGPLGNTIAGFGYDVNGEGSQCLYFEGDTNNPICPVDGVVTTSAYNYDYWIAADPNDYWRSGWYDGYWSYQVKDNISDDFSYSGLGASSRELQNGSVDGWGYQDGWESFEGVIPKAPYVAAQPPAPPVIHVEEIYLDEISLNLQVGSSRRLNATILPVTAENKDVTWASGNNNVASVSQNGDVKALSAGVARITVTTTDGNHTVACLVVVSEKIETLVEQPTDSTIVVSFPKVEQASHYNVSLYRIEESGEVLEATHKLDATDNPSIELQKRSTSNAYRVQVEAIQHFENKDYVIATQKSDISAPVANEPITAEAVSARYLNGQLELTNLKGYVSYITGLDGRVVDALRVNDDYYRYPVKLPSGIYILSNVKEGKRTTLKFIVR